MSHGARAGETELISRAGRIGVHWWLAFDDNHAPHLELDAVLLSAAEQPRRLTR